MQGKALIASVLVIMALVFCGISLMAPWYTINEETSSGSYSFKTNFVFYFDHVEFSYLGSTSDIDYDDAIYEKSSFPNTLRTTQTLVFIAMIGCVFGIIGAALVTFEKFSRNLGVICVLIALILCLIAPMYLMFALPGSFQKDFADSEELSSRVGIKSGKTWFR
jgi:ABC-type phosphate/phosphonate transport system permease subunit